MAIEKIRASRVNTINSDQYAGNVGLIWYDPDVGDLRIYANGVPGGMLINSGGGNGTPGGSNSQVQFNQSGAFGGSANLTFDRTIGALTAVSFAGNGAGLTSIAGANVTGTVANATYATTAATVTDAAQPNITSVGTLTSIVSSGNISTTGNITSNYFLGNGSQLTGLPATYGNANVVANLAALGSNPISTTGNVTAGYLLGNGSILSSITGANVTGTVANATYALSANSASSLVNGASSVILNSDGTMVFPNNNINTGANSITLWSTDSSSLLWRDAAGGAPSQPVQTIIEAGNGAATITVSTGVLAVQSQKIWTFDSAGNTTFPDATVQTTAYPGNATAFSITGNITGGNVLTGGLISSTGNITGGNLNAVGLSLSGNVVSTINSTANIITTGNIRAGNLIGSNLTATRIPFVGTGGVITDSIVMYTDQPNQLLYVGGGGAYIGGTGGFGTVSATSHVGGVISVTANVTGGNIRTGGQVSATGNITGGNVLSNGQLSTAGNITGGNITVGGAMTAVGNIAASWVQAAYYTGTWGTNFVSTGNVSGTNITTAGLISATGNITGGNVIAISTVYGNAATAFVAGDAAISGVALQIPQEGALRNLTNGLTNMYFDVSIGGSTNGQFQFRSSSSFTNVLTMSPTAFNVNTEAVVTAKTASFGRLPWNSAIDTELTIDDYRWRITNSGGIYAQVISNTGGTKNSAWTAVAAISGSAITQGGSTGILLPNNSWTTLYTFGSMASAGDTVTVTFQDKSQGRIYRVTFMRSDNGSTTGYNIIAERLL